MNALERNIRSLVRRLHDDPQLHSLFGDWLRRAFHAENASVALERALEEALGGLDTAHRTLLSDVILNPNRGRMSDRTYHRAKTEAVERLGALISRRITQQKRPLQRSAEATPIALPMVDRLVPESISPNHYRGADRGRALSAAALCAEMSGEQERADIFILEAEQNVRDQFDRRDVASSFEVAQNEFFIARCRGDLAAMRAAIRGTARLHDRLSDAARLKVALDCSEVFLYEGRLQEARSELNFALLNASPGNSTLLRSIALVRTAQIAAAARDLVTAEAAAIAATQTARSHADIRVYAAEVLARSALHTGNPWSSEGLETCQSVFHALSVRTLLARQHLRRADLDAAYEMAKKTLDDALRVRYWNLASCSAATLAACFSAAQAESWIAQALRFYLCSGRQNAYIGDDLFPAAPEIALALRGFLNSDEAAEVVVQTYASHFPDSCLAALGATRESLLFRLAWYVLDGLESASVPSCDFGGAAIAWRMQEANSLAKLEADVRRLGNVASALSILVPIERRSAFVASAKRRTRHAVHALRRSIARRHWAVLRRIS